ncbi:MAG: hypothetical protein IPH44_43275 [Myxococcales bacterium]|nr:hypothetical protein [Myxococcales bacterium]MBK7192780.1 hypothetical protein [Myxococcales bacterium]MBP6846459.1 hypothetical protein [Kofleriaceae bacterium]
MGIAISHWAPARAPRSRAATDETAAPSPPDGFLDSLAKLVPGEVLAGYVAALQAPGVGDHRAVHLGILVVFTALAPLVLWASARRSGGAHWLQYVVRTAAFVLVAAGGDPVLLAWLDGLRFVPSVGAIVIVTLAAVILAPPSPTAPARR